MATERVRFPSAAPDAAMHEGEVWIPDGAESVPGVVVAHPNSLRGGSMDNNTVVGMCRGLQAAGIAWLRFNFRGVGASEGRYTDGVEEVHDLRGALAFLG